MKIKMPPSLAVVTAGIIVVLVGCSKKTAESSAATPEASNSAAPVQQPVAAPVFATVAAPDAHLAQSQAALKAKDYDTAAAALITAQRAKLNEQQAAAAAAQMRQLQANIAEAAAAGDPRAKAAADRLRQASMSR